MDHIPDDANGDVLRRMLAHGDDLSVPRVFDFEHLFSDQGSARTFAAAAEALGFSTKTHLYDEQPRESGTPNQWNVTVNTLMPADHAAITAIESELGALANTMGGYADGWGCMHGTDKHAHRS